MGFGRLVPQRNQKTSKGESQSKHDVVRDWVSLGCQDALYFAGTNGTSTRSKRHLSQLGHSPCPEKKDQYNLLRASCRHPRPIRQNTTHARYHACHTDPRDWQVVVRPGESIHYATPPQTKPPFGEPPHRHHSNSLYWFQPGRHIPTELPLGDRPPAEVEADPDTSHLPICKSHSPHASSCFPPDGPAVL